MMSSSGALFLATVFVSVVVSAAVLLVFIG
jgi:hypothetical protein